MLARLKQTTTLATPVISPLAGVTVPTRPASIKIADEAAAAAFAELEAIRARHRNAVRQSNNQKAGEPVIVSRQDCDDIGKEITGFQVKYEDAAAKAKAEREDYQAAVDALTAEPLRAHAAEMSRRLEELAALAADGAALFDAARLQAIELPNSIGGLCGHFINLSVQTGRGVLAKAKDRQAR